MRHVPKHKELKRNHQIMLRLTDTEYEIISSNAKTLLPLAEYARKLIGKTPKITYEIVADLPELKKLIGEFENRQQLNQIARYLIAAVSILRKCESIFNRALQIF